MLSAIAFRAVPTDAGSAVLPRAAGDFNGDGKLDILAEANDGSEHLWTIPGNGDGTFGRPIDTRIAEWQIQAVADLNGDGKQDLVAIGFFDGIDYSLGNGDGTFQPFLHIPTRLGLSEVRVADVNADGKADLLVSTSWNAGVDIYYGDGDGSFPATPQLLDLPGYQFTTGDFDNDGRQDIAVSGYDNLYIAHNNGDGTFTSTAQAPAFPIHNSELTAADLNGDGKTDLAFSSNGVVWSSLNQGSNSFAAPQQSRNGEQLVPATLTNDGRTDLISTSSQFAIQYFTGSNSGLDGQTGPFAQSPIAVGDFNGDGLTDFAAPDPAVQNSWAGDVLLNLSDRIVGLQASPRLHAQPQDAALAHFTDNLAINTPLGGITTTINWGDSSSSAGTVVFDGNGAYRVVGSHTYATNGVHKYAVTITDGHGQTATVSGTDDIEGLPPAAPGNASLVKDLNTASAGSDPSWMVSLNGRVLLAAQDAAHGSELWSTDGTAGGTMLVKDINPGWASSNPNHLVSADGDVYFAATGADGLGVWKSDGTEAGTIELASVVPTWGVSAIAAAGGKIYFIAAATPNGPVLWVSDGTPQGTHPLEDPTGNPFLANRLVPFGDTFYFFGAGYDAVSQWYSGLYRSDGTSAGTSLVKNVSIGQITPTSVVAGNRLFFSPDGSSLWTSDGTPGGTLQLASLAVGAMAVLNDSLLVGSFANGQAQLWKSDGTPAGTVLLTTIPSGTQGYAPQYLTTSGSFVYFAAHDQDNQQDHLWKTDGTPGGTVAVNPDSEDPGYPQNLIDVGGTLYFTGNDSGGQRLWKSDGTAAGTGPVTNVKPVTYFHGRPTMFAYNGTLLFSGDDGVLGDELWKTDGTSSGTVPVADINTGTVGSSPTSGAQLNGKFYLSSSNGLWASDGTDAGTTLLLSGQSDEVTAFNGYVYFTHYDSARRFWLCRTDGTAAGTVQLQSLYPLPTYPPTVLEAGLTVVNGLLYYEALNGNAVQVWRSNGTPQGTVSVASGPSYLGAPGFLGVPFYVLGSRVLLESSSGGLYSGSSPVGPGTYRASYNSAPYPHDATLFNGQLYYISGTGNTPALWHSDGTAAGTKIVAPVGSVPLTGSAYMTVFNGRLLFGAGGKLWTSDGAAAGTLAIANLTVSEIRVSGATAYVSGDDGNFGVELWTTDGTAAGTALLADINPGPDASAPGGLTPVGDLLYFTADDGQHGREVWVSDGTSAGTRLVQDVNADPKASPLVLGSAAGQLYFSADDSFHGMEPWVVAIPGVLRGTVFHDANHNGVRDPGETGLAGLTVFLDANRNGRLDAGEITTATDALGRYGFGYTPAGTYTVRSVLPGNWRLTTPMIVSTTLAAGQITGPVFGEVSLSEVPMDFWYLLTLAQHFRQAGGFAQGDANDDGTVDFADLLLVAQNYGHPLPTSASAPLASAGDGFDAMIRFRRKSPVSKLHG